MAKSRNSIIAAVKTAASKATKWTLTEVANDKGMSIASLRFIPFELVTGLNASSFQEYYLEGSGLLRRGYTSGNPKTDKLFKYSGIAARGMSLIRATACAAELIGKFHGKPTKRLLECWTDEAQAAILATDEAEFTLKEKQTALASMNRKAERLALLGYLGKSNEEALATSLALEAIRAEIKPLQDALKEAREHENEISERLVKDVWLKGEESEADTKAEADTKTKTDTKTK